MAASTQLKLSMLAELLHERATVLAQMHAAAEDFRGSRPQRNEVPTSDYERDEMLYSLLSDRLLEIDEALQRFEMGVYGTCAGCGNDIPPARLRVQPSSSLCVSCQAERDQWVKVARS